MKMRLSMGLALGLAMSSAAFAAGETANDALLTAHKAFMQAYKTCNTTALTPMLSDDMRFLHAGGMLQEREAFVKGVAACSLTDLTSDVTNVRLYGDTGLVMGKLNYKTKTVGGILYFTQVYVKKNGKKYKGLPSALASAIAPQNGHIPAAAVR